MLQSYSSLSKDVADTIKEEVRTVLSSKIQMLLEAIFERQEGQWYNLLLIGEPTIEQQEAY